MQAHEAHDILQMLKHSQGLVWSAMEAYCYCTFHRLPRISAANLAVCLSFDCNIHAEACCIRHGDDMMVAEMVSCHAHDDMLTRSLDCP